MAEQTTGGTLNLVKPQMSETGDKVIKDLSNSMQTIDDNYTQHTSTEFRNQQIMSMWGGY